MPKPCVSKRPRIARINMNRIYILHGFQGFFDHELGCLGQEQLGIVLIRVICGFENFKCLH